MNINSQLYEYNAIIINRQNNPLPKEVYTEKHHIIPKSCGGCDEKWNLVRLLPEEHYRCHKLLPEIYKGGKEHYAMVCAWHFMSTNGKYTVSEEEYAAVKKSMSIEYKKRYVDNPGLRLLASERAKKWMRENPESLKRMIEHHIQALNQPEVRQKLREAIRKRSTNPEYIKRHSEGQKKRFERKEERELQRQRKLGKPMSMEAREKMSKSQNKRYLNPAERQKHACKGEKNGMYGRRGKNSIPHQMMWIKNEQLGESRYVNKSTKIPEGWELGRLNMYDRKKFAKRWITDGYANKLIPAGDKIPDGWRLGKSHCKLAVEKKWITNGIESKLVNKDSELSMGWRFGIHHKNNVGGATTTGMFWINNGIEQKFSRGDVPEGWKRGRLSKKKL